VQPNNNWMFQEPVEDAVAKHLREENKESYLKMGEWNPDGYFMPSRDRARMQYTPRLMAMKSVWEDVSSKYKKVSMQRPAIMDIDVLYAELPIDRPLTTGRTRSRSRRATFAAGPTVRSVRPRRSASTWVAGSRRSTAWRRRRDLVPLAAAARRSGVSPPQAPMWVAP